MKKKTTPQLAAVESEIQLAQIIPIRTETVLSQYPIHRLAKKGNIEITVTKANERGKVMTVWDVSPSRRYGEPGPLAYKLDTLLINRLIDEARPNIPELLKLGSLAQIARELDLGSDTNLVKNALHQNASAYITVKLDYTSNDGTRRKFEFGATRYEVIFTGEELPNGQKADAVYIALHRSFRELLNHAKTRPLDYEYLKSLPPAAQRLYELLSFQIFAALRHGNPRAKYLYSELCRFAPLTRYDEWEKVKKQLYKIHQPHKESGYISKVEFEEIRDGDGRADWVMWYTPGVKARREFKEFTTRRERNLNATPTRPHLVEAKTEKGREVADSLHSPEAGILIEKLIGFGIDDERAAQLVARDRAQCELWAEAWPHQNKKGMDNPPAVLISFIEKKRRTLPKGYQEARASAEKQKRHEEEQARQRAEESYFRFFEPAFRAYQKAEFSRTEQSQVEAAKSFSEWFEKNHTKHLRFIESDARRAEVRTARAAEFFNELHPEWGVRFTDFAEWNAQHNPDACDPREWFERDPQGILDELDRRLSARG